MMNLLGDVLGYSRVAVAAWAGAALVGREPESGGVVVGAVMRGTPCGA
ncbi:hypothetical protein ABZ619_41555 [Streptomyces sp. NPDC007851]